MIKVIHISLGVLAVFIGMSLERSSLAVAPQQVEGLVNIQFHQDVRVFAVSAAINAAGFDIGASELARESARRIVRESIASIDPDLRNRLRSFYSAHLKEDSGLNQQGAYISFALFLSGPPGFVLDLDPGDLPPEVKPLVGFEVLLREFWIEANLAPLWEIVGPRYAEESSIYRPLIRNMILDTLKYLRTQARVSLDRRVTFIPNLLNAFGAVNARNLSNRYFLIVGPSEKGRRPMGAVRHEYLHFLLDPLVNKYRGYLPEPEPFLAHARIQDKALQPFVDDFPLMVAESLIRMVELGMDGVSGMEAKSSVIREYDRGLILSPYFHEALRGFEAGEEDLEDFIPELIKAIDWEVETGRDASIGEMRRSLALHGEQISRGHDEETMLVRKIRTLLSLANDLLMKRKFDEAEELLKDVLLLDKNDPSALLGLAQVAAQRQALDLALDFYARAAASAGERTWIAGWAHLRRGNIFKLRGELGLARSEWSKVLQLQGDLHGADEQARMALSQANP